MIKNIIIILTLLVGAGLLMAHNMLLLSYIVFCAGAALTLYIVYKYIA